MRRFFSLLPLAFLLLFQCTPCPAAQKSKPKKPKAKSIAQLRTDLKRLFQNKAFAPAQLGVKIVSLERGDTIYEQNQERLLVPASNNKLLTSCAALLRLGADFRYETRVFTDGQISHGVLTGNLIVAGSGDPTINGRFLAGDPYRVFRDWAARLQEIGVKAIQGDLIGDDEAFQEQMLGAGWEWNDLGSYSAAPVNALQFNENIVALRISPGLNLGEAALITATPLDRYLTVHSKLVTAPAKSDLKIELERTEIPEAIAVRGNIPLGSKPVLRNVSVQFPTYYFLKAFKQILSDSNIDVSRCNTIALRGAGHQNTRLLSNYNSPPLQEILKPLLKESQNLYTETLLRTLGAVLRKEGSFDQGKEVLEETLEKIGIEKDSYAFEDGSGLSRLNLVSAEALVRLLKYMHKLKEFPAFYDALPIAGVDGTISQRLKGTRAADNVRAKSGSIARVRALSGYVRTAKGELLAFSFLANNFLVPGRDVEALMDSALVMLSDFSR
jgi:D-alanyl-D-alanine carboxypeptidase/D-alanyl-D-alanine-endopeptidase (penicillin-binding protein 4)